jgi:hypothetical protein
MSLREQTKMFESIILCVYDFSYWHSIAKLNFLLSKIY